MAIFCVKLALFFEKFLFLSTLEKGGELPGERWNPTQSVRTVLLSIISILNDPNTYSPANVDASVAFRNWKEGKDNKYKDVIQKQVSFNPEFLRLEPYKKLGLKYQKKIGNLGWL